MALIKSTFAYDDIISLTFRLHFFISVITTLLFYGGYKVHQYEHHQKHQIAPPDNRVAQQINAEVATRKVLTLKARKKLMMMTMVLHEGQICALKILWSMPEHKIQKGTKEPVLWMQLTSGETFLSFSEHEKRTQTMQELVDIFNLIFVWSLTLWVVQGRRTRRKLISTK